MEIKSFLLITRLFPTRSQHKNYDVTRNEPTSQLIYRGQILVAICGIIFSDWVFDWITI